MILFLSEINHTRASFRYRVLIPAKHFTRYKPLIGAVPTKETEVCIFNKCGSDHEMTVAEHFEGVKIWDVCDDHFNDRYSENYHRMAELADYIVVPTRYMRKMVKAYAGRQSTVIEDPYEFDLEEPTFTGEPKLLWYGHRSNLKILDGTPIIGELEIVTDCIERQEGPVKWISWSPDNLKEAFKRCEIVIIPQDKKHKSHNRAVEAIRQGKLVVASPIPAYKELPIWTGDIKTGIKWAVENPDKAQKLIETGQEYIEKFNPVYIANKWENLLDRVYSEKDCPNGQRVLTRERKQERASV